ncbi:MAG TPA: alpha-amylase/4-alpha-glucanotransferase domain-containing protein [Burkholderiales bacterium]|nr:alpha-amylase/4-alpha-glucanotransferase domain-containing protein [Burkholderiales bacterium]
MNRKVSLLFGVHAHQPAGNFEHVIDDAHARCYKPFIETVHGYPDFKLSVHFSGWLLDYLLKRYPADMAKLREMVARGQVEMFGGGDTEPVLASIPERDRRSQLKALSDRLDGSLGQRPSGAWLTERVWESSVASSLADSNIRYVTVDDYHFLCAGRNAAELTGYFSTEESGRRLDLFPISEALRYRIPFSTAPEAIQYLESLATEDGAAAAIYFDDIEKLGIWPETYVWVYEKQWLKQFIEGVLASPSIEPALYRDFHSQQRSRGVMYLPTTSYIEMNEWTLNADRADRFAELVQREKDQQRYEQNKPFLRGGIWRNFMSRYAESNWMHKRMQQLSERLHALGDRATPQMREQLHLAQANDAYWHGLFGGIYLPHLRRAVWNGIVALEALLDQAAPRNAQVGDPDLDGYDEFFLGNGILQAVIRDDGLGAIHEFDAYALRHNFGDTLARRPEHYYRKIRDHRGQEGEHHGSGIASAHDRVNFRHPVSPEDLEPDALPRALFIDRRDGQPLRYGRPVVHGARAELFGNGIGKTVSIEGNRLVVAYKLGSTASTLETEINLAMPSCDGFLGRYLVNAAVPGGLGEVFTWEGIDEVALEDGVLKGRVTLRCDCPMNVSAAPHKTVSQSEDGFEKIMQAVTLRISVPGQQAFSISLTVEPLPG